MLLTQPRRAILTFCLVAMQIAWFTPYVLLVAPAGREPPVLAVYAGLVGIVVLWLLLLEALNRFRIASPQYELAVLGLVVLSTFVFLRILVYADRTAGDLSWAWAAVRSIFDLSLDAGRIFVVLIINVILWQRATAATGQQPSFMAVGFSFRGGTLLLILGAALVGALTAADVRPLLFCYFALGLTAVALARVDDKSSGVHSQGTPLPPARFAQLLGAVAVTVGLAALFSLFVNRSGLLALIRWLDPAWPVLGVLFDRLILVLGWLLQPVFAVVEWLLRRLLTAEVLQNLAQALQRLGNIPTQIQSDEPTAIERIPPWVWTVLRYALVALVLAIVLGFALLYLERLRRSRLEKQAEDETGERVTLGGGMLNAALGRLRDLAGLVRRYGLNRQLLAAVSVQNIYANVTRLARLRGYPRQVAQPPDDYLPMLRRAFAGQDSALEHITAAYMRVHYGDRPVTQAELAALRADYHRLRRTERPEETPGS